MSTRPGVGKGSGEGAWFGSEAWGGDDWVSSEVACLRGSGRRRARLPQEDVLSGIRAESRTAARVRLEREEGAMAWSSSGCLVLGTHHARGEAEADDSEGVTVGVGSSCSPWRPEVAGAVAHAALVAGLPGPHEGGRRTQCWAPRVGGIVSLVGGSLGRREVLQPRAPIPSSVPALPARGSP